MPPAGPCCCCVAWPSPTTAAWSREGRRLQGRRCAGRWHGGGHRPLLLPLLTCSCCRVAGTGARAACKHCMVTRSASAAEAQPPPAVQDP